jgi:hypothetical protein
MNFKDKNKKQLTYAAFTSKLKSAKKSLFSYGINK